MSRELCRRFTLVLTLLALIGGLLSCGEEGSGPRAWIDYPREGASVPVGNSVMVMSHAYAREGVAEVVLSVDGEPYRRDAPTQSGADFVEVTQEWRPEEEGVYTLQVTTYSATGEPSSPATVSVKVVGAAAQLPATPTFAPTPTWTPLTPRPITPTFSPTPTFTPVTPRPITPTFTPTPTRTPTPYTPSPAADIRLWADSDAIQAGSCTMVRWHASNVSAYWVNDQARTGDEGSFQTCPCEEETHSLRATLQDGAEQNLSLTIRVSGQCITPPPPDTTVGVPSPAVPHDGAVIDCVSEQTLLWVPIEAPGGSVRYYVKLEQRIGGQWQSVRGWGPVSGKQVDASVECGADYRWAVRAEDGAGNFSDWSSWSRFSVAEEAPPPPPQDTTAPPVPAPQVPADGAELSCRTSQTLVWLPVDDPSGISAYYVKLEISPIAGQWQSVRGWGPVSGKQVDAEVQCGGIYRWAVRAEDGAGNISQWSPWVQFAVAMQ